MSSLKNEKEYTIKYFFFQNNLFIKIITKKFKLIRYKI